MDIEKIRASFQLVATTISTLKFDNTFLSYDERLAGDKKIDVQFKVITDEISTDGTQRIGVLDLHVSVSCEIEGKSFHMYLVVRGVFLADAEMEAKTFSEMLRLNGCAALYSMARASISSISTQMFSIGNIVLPMANFITFNQLKDEE